MKANVPTISNSIDKLSIRNDDFKGDVTVLVCVHFYSTERRLNISKREFVLTPEMREETFSIEKREFSERLKAMFSAKNVRKLT